MSESSVFVVFLLSLNTWKSSIRYFVKTGKVTLRSLLALLSATYKEHKCAFVSSPYLKV